jgi:hypothetical protein
MPGRISTIGYVAEIQLPGNGIRLLSITHLAIVLPRLAIGDLSHHVKYKCFMTAACADRSLQLSISAEIMRIGSHFNLSSEY